MAWLIPCSRNPQFRKWSFDARNSGFNQATPIGARSVSLREGESAPGGIV